MFHRIEFKVARNSLLARATCAPEHCHWITADARNIQHSADVGRILYINGYYFIFLAYTNVCSVTELT